MSRQAELLRAAADALDAGDDPFHFSFLSEHEVTSDEVITMAGLTALGAQLVAWAIDHPREASAAMKGAGQGLQYKAVMDGFARLAAAGG